MLIGAWDVQSKAVHLALTVTCILVAILPLEVIVVHSRLAFYVLVALAAGWGIAYLLARLDRGILDDRIYGERAQVERSRPFF